MGIEGGGYILTEDQETAWKNSEHSEEYYEYVEAGLYDPETNVLLDIPSWMADADPNNGPFDFILNPSWGSAGT